MMETHRILFVCMGNICRSPSAEGVFRKLVTQHQLENQFEIDSAGTGGWHIGSAPDQRAQQAAQARNIDISAYRARQVCAADMVYYHHIIAMDTDNQQQLFALADDAHQHKIRLLLEYADSADEIEVPLEVPDPYYGGENGFNRVLDLIEDGCQKLLAQLLAQSSAKP